MTGPVDPAESDERNRATGASGPATHGPPGSALFSLEGRAAPGLYLVGWLGSILGLAILLAIVFSGVSGPGGFALLITSLVFIGVGLVAAAGSQGLERRTQATAGYVGPSPFLVFGAALAWTVLTIVIVGRPLIALGLEEESPLAAFVSVTLTAAVYLGLIRLLVVGTGALSWQDMGIRGASLARNVEHLLSGATYAIPVLFVTGILAQVLFGLLGVAPEGPLPETREGLGLLLNVISAGIVAPVGEEVFFRGFATTAWARTMGGSRAVVRGAIFFAFVHILTLGVPSGTGAGTAVLQALFVFLVRLPVGLVLGWLFLRRGSIMVPIGLHAAFNTVQIVLAQVLLSP